jgi:ABC-type glycerol-3-phosphate transport system substrate-binding protein
MVLYYNRSLLTQGGVATPPTTWEAVTGLAENLTQQQAGNITESVVPFGAYDNVEDARGIISLLLLQAGNAITAATTGGVRSQLTAGGAPGSASPSAAALNFYAQFADPAKTVYTWNRALPSARQSFLSGSLLFYPGFASELPDLKAANPNLDFDMAPIPQPQTAASKSTYARAYAFAIPKVSKNASGALTAAFALANSSHAQTVATSLFMAPAVRSALTPGTNDLYQPVFFPQALIAKGWLSPSPADTDRIFSTMIGNITSGRATADQAVQSADQALNAALQH